VTGVASGIGRATAETFARVGASVVLADLSADKGEEEAKRLRDAGLKASFAWIDVGSDQAIAEFAKTVLSRGEVHVLANVVGYGKGQAFASRATIQITSPARR
jgi:NAD(P)-dependent dehydrogenase (short-subunit alcohol dehydrogenase family)